MNKVIKFKFRCVYCNTLIDYDKIQSATVKVPIVSTIKYCDNCKELFQSNAKFIQDFIKTFVMSGSV